MRKAYTPLIVLIGPRESCACMLDLRRGGAARRVRLLPVCGTEEVRWRWLLGGHVCYGSLHIVSELVVCWRVWACAVPEGAVDCSLGAERPLVYSEAWEARAGSEFEGGATGTVGMLMPSCITPPHHFHCHNTSL